MEKTKLAEIITIGDELLIGQVIDTNSAFIAQSLGEHGIEVQSIVSVHDEREQILAALRQATANADLVLLTGGLGPTKDDITKRVLCEFFDTDLVDDNTVRQHIHDLYASRPAILNKLTETQWQVPRNCTVLENSVGSAPIMLWQNAGANNAVVVSMPGVPYEMEIAMRDKVLPYLESIGFSKGRQIIHRNVLVYGVPESTLALRIAPWEDALPHTMHLAYLPKDGIVRLRLSSYGEHTAAEVESEEKTLLSLLGDSVIATEDKPIEVLVGEQLRRLNATIATAESCTGGKLAVLLSKHSGSSDFYKGSVIAYSNEVKKNVLNVSSDDLSRYGAVSEAVVAAMARGVQQVLGVDYAVATSGVAGPTGGTPDKPVGTVWIAVATPDEVVTELLHLGRLREKNTDRATLAVLVKLLRILQNK